ncbi:uncharacterized protein EAE97_011041 [Botrytis byssoidea]|uniref:Cytochrome P450 n=1 Tax=Botrytis byssoidea TaxID=139641 RepID=A0A9P5I4K3_9HELO|nr:uncharacterized protein EAE97_011041 [Botrytis byssoidea]KAF7922877.1 hypothetical protein EAE97_011041 [Botrytis byssoidea]
MNFIVIAITAASRIPLSYWKFKGVLPYKLKELDEQYGDAVRVAPNFLDYNSSVAWEDIYGFVKAHHKKNFPRDLMERGVKVNPIKNIITADEENHRKFRRIQSHMFSEKALTSQEPLIQDYARQFISELVKFSSLNSDNSIDIGKWYNFATFDLIGDLAFGESFDCVKTGETNSWIDLIFQTIEINSLVNEAKKKYPILGALALFFVPKDLLGKYAHHDKLAREKAYRRLDAPRDIPDFMSYIIKHNDTDKGMTREEIGENASILIIAGSETQEDLTLHALASSKYINAVLEEGFRIYSPVPTTLPRIVPKGGSVVAGQFVPAGTTVGVNPISSHLSAEYFHLPYEFHHERWLSTADVEHLKSTFPDVKLLDPKIFENDDRKACQPFSVGPANCIGKNLAYAEMRVLLGNVGARDSGSWLERNRIYALWKKPELWVKLKRVNV